MKERPILFSAPMVRALLDGTKTQTRRVVKGTDLEAIKFLSDEDNDDAPGFLVGDGHSGKGVYAYSRNYPDEGAHLLKCPYGAPGDRLWVRETFVFRDKHDRYYYRADSQHDPYAHNGWSPSIHMPRKASRIDLEITGVRVERLNDISEADAIAEGWPKQIDPGAETGGNGGPFDWYRGVWEAINGAGSWDLNPWVWSITFKRVRP